MPIFVLRLAETAESRPFETPNSALSHKLANIDGQQSIHAGN